MKKIFLVALFFMYGCRTYNPNLVANEYKYDTNKLSENYNIYVYNKPDNYHYGDPKETQIVFSSNKKAYKVKLERESVYIGENIYNMIMMTGYVFTFGTLALTGIPIKFDTEKYKIKASIYSDNNNVIRSIYSEKDATEVVAAYYGYNEKQAEQKASDIAYYRARNDIFKQLESISIDEINNVNKDENAKIEKEKLAQKKKQQQINAANKKKAEERRKKLVEKYGERTADAIMKQEIFRGMSESALVESWGKPQEINSSVGSWGTHKQYVYWGDYVYVENGIVESWQTSR